MSNGARLRGIVVGMLMIVCGVLVALIDGAESWIALILACNILLWGASTLFTYFWNLRRMVGGARVLWMGVIIFDLGVIALAMVSHPTIIVALYLILTHAFKGVVNIAGGFLSRADNPLHWRWSVISGVFRLLIAVMCLVNMHDYQTLQVVWGIGFAAEGVMRISTALRPTAMLFIP